VRPPKKRAHTGILLHACLLRAAHLVRTGWQNGHRLKRGNQRVSVRGVVGAGMCRCGQLRGSRLRRGNEHAAGGYSAVKWSRLQGAVFFSKKNSGPCHVLSCGCAVSHAVLAVPAVARPETRENDHQARKKYIARAQALTSHGRARPSPPPPHWPRAALCPVPPCEPLTHHSS
jgi:hypothetical protein